MPIDNFDRIPNELKELKQWCLWKYEDVGAAKPTKVPYGKEGNKLSVIDPNHWITFADAVSTYRSNGYSGIGFIFTQFDPYAFIDLDATDNKEHNERQLKIFKEFDSYSEKSPSGKGLHIIVKGSIAQGRKRADVEIYSSGRYATMTGNIFNLKQIEERSDLLNQLYEQMAGPPQIVKYTGNEEQKQSDEEIRRIAENAVNGNKFSELFNGNWQQHYSSQSEADFAIIDIIAFYTQNRAQINRIFRGSSLGKRDKAQRKDYVDGMITRSFDRLLPKMDFDGFRIQLESKLEQEQLPLPLEQLSLVDNGSVVQSVEPAVHNSQVASSSLAASTNNQSPKSMPGSEPGIQSTINPPPGLVGEIAQFIYQAAPRPVPEIAIAAGLGLMAGICGRAYNVSGTGLNQYILCLAMTGCHAKGTKILMYNGTLKNVEDIQKNDLLMGPDSEPRKVLSLARGREPMVKIKPIKGEEFIVNENHILSLVDTETRVRTNIKFIDWLHTPNWFKHRNKLERRAVEFKNNSLLSIDPWFLGAMLGDGQIGPKITLTSQDDSIRNRATDIIKKLGMAIRTSQVIGNKSYQDHYSKEFDLSNSKSILQRYFEAQGLWLTRSNNKFIPSEYKTADKFTRQSVLAGLLDTDGSLTNNGYDFISKSEQLANDVCFIARSLGLASYLKSCKKYSQLGSGGIYYRVSISGDCSTLPMTLNYKKAKPRTQKKDVLVTGFNFEYLTEDNYYGFALDNDHLYLTGDFTVHHNTGKEAMASGIDKLINAVQLSVPVASEFIGPSEIASGQALIKYLANKSQSFVSILGEFGLRLRSMSSERANGAEIALRRMLLDLYNKSGHGQVARPSIYADSEKNTNLIVSPAFSILGESTPERFYDILNEEMISEGLLPRFMLIEYNGARPKLNENAMSVQPPDWLISKISTLMANAKTVMNQRGVIEVTSTDDATKMLKDFDKLADSKINSTDKEIIRQLWNRAHIKVLKISALIAVGIHPFNPVISVDDVLWAKQIVENDVKALSDKFEMGMVGKTSDELKQIEDMRKAIKRYVTEPWEVIYKYCDDQRLHSSKVVPASYLSRRLYAMASFRTDKIGSANALKRTIQNLVDGDYLQEVASKEMTERFGIRPKAFIVTNAKWLLKE